MKNFEITFRKAREDDDISKIAKYIYLTDPYIYPSICDSPTDKRWIEIISCCYESPNNIFYRDNLFVVLSEGDIIGICCIIPCGKRLSFDGDLKALDCISDRLLRVIDGYFKPLLEESLTFDGYNIVNLCIDGRFHNRGVGRQLLAYCLSHYVGETIYLDVIADNLPAVRLYKSSGFEIAKEYFGFSGSDKPLPCYLMKKQAV